MTEKQRWRQRFSTTCSMNDMTLQATFSTTAAARTTQAVAAIVWLVGRSRLNETYSPPMVAMTAGWSKATSVDGCRR